MVDRRGFIKGAALLGGMTVVGVPFLAGCDEPPADVSVSGNRPGGFMVPAGELWEIVGLVTTNGNVVVEGTLRMRAGAELRFVDVNEGAFVGGGMAPIASDVGLWVINDGVVDAKGSGKSSWTRAQGALTAGQSQVTVDAALAWKPGDVLVFAPTRKETSWTGSGRFTGYSTRRIVSVEGAAPAVVTLDGPLQSSHPVPVDQHGRSYPAEVLNLTRDVKITGTPGGRSHVIFAQANKPIVWRDVELAHLGVPGVLGRYPLHVHMMGEASAGSTFERVVAHDCGNHAFVPHTSHGVTFSECVAHQVDSDAFWWDQGAVVTNDLVWRLCVASAVDGGYRTGGFNLGPSDHGRRNTIEDCVAFGIQGDGGVDLSGRNSNDSAGFLWPEEDDGDIDWVWVFRRNVAHNNRHNGLFSWQNDDLAHVVSDSVVYNCATGINHGAYANRYHYERVDVFDCYLGVWEHAASSRSVGGQTFDDVNLAVVGPRAVNLNSVTAGSVGDRVVQFVGCDFSGYTAQAIRAGGDGGGPADDEWPGRWDFRDTTWAGSGPHVVIESGAPAGTEIRELEGGVLVAIHNN